MNSLQDLNGYSSTSLQVSDNRPSTVKFDRIYPLTPLNQLFTFTTTINTIGPGINIVEIVNFSQANVRYRITIQNFGTPAFTGSTVSWSSLPAGVSLSQVGSVYTFTGISTPEQWNAIKSFIWTLPSNYASFPTWNIKAEIIYYDGALGHDVTVSWLAYDPRYYFRAQVYATSSLTAKGQYYRAQGKSNISSGAILTAKGRRIAKGISLITSTGTVTCTLSAVIKGLVGRSYYKNTRNPFWQTLDGSTQAAKPSLSSETFSSYSTIGVILTVSAGTLAYENGWIGPGSYDYVGSLNPSSTWSYNSTSGIGNINSVLEYVVYYPAKNQTSNPTLTFQVIVNNTTVYITKTITLLYAGIGTGFNAPYVGRTLTYTASSSFTPLLKDLTYGTTFDYLLVGGGGGAMWGGGGAATYVESFNNTLTTATKNITIGTGGAGRVHPGGAGLYYAYNGTNSTFNGSTAYGGRGAGPTGQVDAYSATYYTGGSNGDFSYSGGTGSTYYLSGTESMKCGGGGAGGASSGGSSSGSSPGTESSTYAGSGGSGYTSSLYSNPVCSGGGGGKSYIVNGFFSYTSYSTVGTSGDYGSGGGGSFNNYTNTPGSGQPGVLIIKINA